MAIRSLKVEVFRVANLAHFILRAASLDHKRIIKLLRNKIKIL